MTSSVAIADTSVLLALESVGLLPLMGRVFDRVLVPVTVRAELLKKEERYFRGQGLALSGLLERRPFRVCTKFDSVDVDLLRKDLHAGEAEVLAQAKTQQVPLVLLDDGAARRRAPLQGCEVAGTARVLARLHCIGICRDYWADVDRMKKRIGFKIDKPTARRALALEAAAHRRSRRILR